MITVSDIIEREHGTRNWVLARRSANMIRRYGDDVVCLSRKQYDAACEQAEYEAAKDHPACELLDKLVREQYPAAGFIRALRAAGWRIEHARGNWTGNY